eukprot:6181484-Pleurochrysis_carterae.AAC.4
MNDGIGSFLAGPDVKKLSDVAGNGGARVERVTALCEAKAGQRTLECNKRALEPKRGRTAAYRVRAHAEVLVVRRRRCGHRRLGGLPRDAAQRRQRRPPAAVTHSHAPSPGHAVRRQRVA